MDKKERVLNALNGKEVDRVPFGVWSAGNNLLHMDWEVTAKAHLKYFEVYEQDFIKVMNEWGYPLPDGITVVRSPADWRRVGLFKADEFWWKQLKILDMINEEVGGEAFFITTVFSPLWIAMRLSRNKVLETMDSDPDIVREALSNISTTWKDHIQEALETGISGVFYVPIASYKIISREKYERFGKPFDLELLRTIEKLPLNVIHLCGQDLFFDLFTDYPAACLNWAVRKTGPSLSEGERRSGKCVMGGLDRDEMPILSEDEIDQHVQEAISQTSGRHFILGPDCTVRPFTLPRLIKAAKKAADSYKIE